LKERRWLYQTEVKLPQELAEKLVALGKKSTAAREAINEMAEAHKNQTLNFDLNTERRAKKADAKQMVPVGVYVYIDQLKWLDEEARQHCASRSSLVRLALDRYLRGKEGGG